jgi:hypothetical protein
MGVTHSLVHSDTDLNPYGPKSNGFVSCHSPFDPDRCFLASPRQAPGTVPGTLTNAKTLGKSALGTLARRVPLCRGRKSTAIPLSPASPHVNIVRNRNRTLTATSLFGRRRHTSHQTPAPQPKCQRSIIALDHVLTAIKSENPSIKCRSSTLQRSKPSLQGKESRPPTCRRIPGFSSILVVLVPVPGTGGTAPVNPSAPFVASASPPTRTQPPVRPRHDPGKAARYGEKTSVKQALARRYRNGTGNGTGSVN